MHSKRLDSFFSNEPKGNPISPRHYSLPVAYRFNESEIWSTSIFIRAIACIY